MKIFRSILAFLEVQRRKPLVVRNFWIFLVGAVAGTFYDWIHVVFGVLSYANPHFMGSSFFVPLEFGLTGLVAAHAAVWLSTKIRAPKVSSRRLMFDLTLLFLAYLMSSIFAHPSQRSFAVILIGILGLVSLATRPSLYVVLATVVAGVFGPVGEAVVSSTGFFRYTYEQPIPIWLPLLWAVAAGLFIDFSVLIHERTRHERSLLTRGNSRGYIR